MSTDNSLRYLKLLARDYPSIQAASAAIITLNAQLNLPKGTEHFLSDLHGEYEAFRHVLKNGSGSVRRKIEDVFADTLTESEKRTLATLIYYPEQKLPLILKNEADPVEWYRITLPRLLKICRTVASKHLQADLAPLLSKHFATILEELLQTPEDSEDHLIYYQNIIDTIITTGAAQTILIALAELIQRLAIARLHIIGDIYDRGPGAHLIMDTLIDYQAVDVQWGNHDIVWMGAAAGSEACIANVIRLCLRYTNLETLEAGYAISLLPLVSLATDIYGNDPCSIFQPKSGDEVELSNHERDLIAKMHKAISVIQFKLEGQIVKRRPQYQMEDRLLLEQIDYGQGTIRLNDTVYPLLDQHFPTIDPANPYELMDCEQVVVDKLKLSFTTSNRLQKHVRFLFTNGGMYLAHNGNLLYHGCIAMNEDGSFKAFKVSGEEFTAKDFMDRVERLARQGYYTTDNPEQKRYGLDAMWYLWSGEQSPLFGKEKMATFERYFIADKATHREQRNAYYDYRDQEEAVRRILQEFNLDPETGYIINGHVPVKVKQGESPIKANGKLVVIDGGFSRAYHNKTGIAGYTLVDHSYGMYLVAHHPFESTQKAIENELDTVPQTVVLESNSVRKRVKDTDLGWEIQQQIDELNELVNAYRMGLIKEC
ncbi:MAG: fructose-1,6-bisphosphatase [Phycisphaerales bacterium]|nr:fructose-1,6-bisphosphatase [Phycisphaerales bacterium]